MREVVHSSTGVRGPNTYFLGQLAIDGIWVSEEIEVSSAAYLPYDPELEDYHPAVANISNELLLGESGQRIKGAAARRLNSKVKRIRQEYINRLDK